jgi:hypothetical protein
MTIEEKSDLKKYRYRELHPNISIGMASDRYAGWIGVGGNAHMIAQQISKIFMLG